MILLNNTQVVKRSVFW